MNEPRRRPGSKLLRRLAARLALLALPLLPDLPLLLILLIVLIRLALLCFACVTPMASLVSLLSLSFSSALATINFAALNAANTVPPPPPQAPPTNFTLARFFADHMVLQHDQPVVVWGRDIPGATVTVAINGGSSYSNATDATGLWRVTMAAHGLGGPHELDISSTSGGAATLQDVYFGSVWVCGGQSESKAARLFC